MLFQRWSGFFRCFLAKPNLALFAPCGEASVFALVKSSLDCRLWQWHVYLLESVLLLAGCCERVFLYHCCTPWTPRPFIPAFHSEGLIPSKSLPSGVRASKGWRVWGPNNCFLKCPSASSSRAHTEAPSSLLHSPKLPGVRRGSNKE